MTNIGEVPFRSIVMALIDHGPHVPMLDAAQVLLCFPNHAMGTLPVMAMITITIVIALLREGGYRNGRNQASYRKTSQKVISHSDAPTVKTPLVTRCF